MRNSLSFVVLFSAVLFLSCRQEKPEADLGSAGSKTIQSPRLPNMDSLNYIMGKFVPEKHPRFVIVAEKYADRPGLLMRERAYLAFIKMHTAAKEAGIKLVIRSATRNFDYQKGIWEKKWSGETRLSNGINAAVDIHDPAQRSLEILKYSAMPGTSRHHWGTDIDLNNFNNAWFESGEGLSLFNWLEKNAPSFGFCRPYTEKNEMRPSGYNEEKWHWSYMPLSRQFTNYAERHLKDSMIQGFSGSETADSIKVVKNYVLGISQECRN